MKTLLTLIFTFFILGNAVSQTLEQNIQEIRTQFKWVNSQKDFSKVILENEEFTDNIPSEGCGLEGFYKNGTLYKIVESDAVSTAVYTTEYYLKNNLLIFVFRKEAEFTRIPETGNITGSETTYEERVYYKNGKIIRHLEKGESVLDKNLDFKKLLKNYKLLLNTKIKHEKEYNLLQGTWIKVNDIDDWFIISGLKRDQYFMADYSDTYRFWIDEQYLYFHFAMQETDFKYKILQLTDDNLKIQNIESGKIEVYEKNKG